jgi:hypothetical protein
LTKISTKTSFQTCWKMWIRLWSMHVSASPLCSISSKILEQRVSGKVDRIRWTNSMACAFPWFILLNLKTSVCATTVSYAQKVKTMKRSGFEMIRSKPRIFQRARQ